MFCRECGKKIEEGNKFCTYCGQRVFPIGYIEKKEEKVLQDEEKTNEDSITEKKEEIKEIKNEVSKNTDTNIIVSKDKKDKKDKPSFWCNLLGFIMPITGVIMYLLKGDCCKTKTKSMLKWSLAGCITRLVLLVIYIVVFAFIFTNSIFTLYDGYDYYDNGYKYEYDHHYNYDKDWEKMFFKFNY